jgi:integrase
MSGACVAPFPAPRIAQVSEQSAIAVASPGHHPAFRSLPLTGNLKQIQPVNCWTHSQYCHSVATADTVRPHNSPTVGPTMATISRLPSGRWRAQIKTRGVRESESFPTRQLANRWATEREAQLEHELTAGPERTRTLAALLVRYRDEVTPGKRGARVERTRIDALIRHYPGLVSLTLAALTPERLGQWRDERLGEVKPATVARYMTVLTAAIEHARREWRWLKTNPMRDVRRPGATPHRERTIHWREIRGLLKRAGYSRARCRTMTEATARAMLFAIRTGMRAGEICALTWKDVKADYVVLRTSKTGEGRNVALSRGARRTIESMRGWHPIEVFGLRPQTLDALFRKLRDAAGLAGFTFHDTRHTAATMLAQRLDVLDLCKMFGWKNTTRALTYYNPTASDIAKRLRSRS